MMVPGYSNLKFESWIYCGDGIYSYKMDISLFDENNSYYHGYIALYQSYANQYVICFSGAIDKFHNMWKSCKFPFEFYTTLDEAKQEVENIIKKLLKLGVFI